MTMVVSPNQTKASKHQASLRLAACIGLLVIFIWGVGFTRFIEAVPRVAPSDAVKADAIVVLTGGAQRLGAGFQLLREGRGASLFVSGVHGDVRASDLHALAVLHETAEEKDLPRCCVEFGTEAQDTKGNAKEIAAWAREKNLKSLIMVTSNYHMQRAFLELRAALPEVQMYRHAVIARTVMLGDLWRWPSSLLLLAGEYHKFLWAGLRTIFEA
jgi:uncharacterized SAM-binding protein YcdF (DUF218 family)